MTGPPDPCPAAGRTGHRPQEAALQAAPPWCQDFLHSLRAGLVADVTGLLREHRQELLAQLHGAELPQREPLSPESPADPPRYLRSASAAAESQELDPRFPAPGGRSAASPTCSFDRADFLRRERAVAYSRHAKPGFSFDQTQPLKSSRRPWRQSLGKMVARPSFELFFAFAICSNSVLIGAEVEYMVHHHDRPMVFLVLNHAYTVLFLVEFVLRLCASGRRLFTSHQAWNFLDLVTVLSSIAEMVIDLIFLVGGSETQSNANISNVRIVRMLRITRMVRTLRLPGLIRFVLALRTLVFSILYTLKSLIWAMILLGMIMYVFGIVFTQSTVDHVRMGGYAHRDLERYWGSIPTSMFTLYKSITGGISWEEAVEPLDSVSVALVVLFTIYIFFTYFAVLNVITASFCESAAQSAYQDPEVIARSLLVSKDRTQNKILQLFKRMDTDNSGYLTVEELESLLTDRTLQAHFEALEIDASDAWSLFKLIDRGSDGAVSAHEFILGCMRLKGTARGMEVAKLMEDHRWLVQRLSRFIHYVEAHLGPPPSSSRRPSEVHARIEASIGACSI